MPIYLIILIIVLGLAILVFGVYKGYLLLVLFGFSIAIYGFYQSYQVTINFEKKLISELISPYFHLIAEENFAKAYQDYTTDAYKAKYSLEALAANYQKIHKERGKMKGMKLYKNVTITNIEGNSTERVTIETSFGSYHIGITLDLVEDSEGHYKINDFFMRHLKGGYPGPW